MVTQQLIHTQHQPAAKKFPLCYLAHNIATPMNIGSLFRVADALGVEKIYLTGTSPVPPSWLIRKTSRSTEKSVPYSYHQDPVEIVAQLKREGYTIISLELTAQSQDIRKLNISPGQKVCLVLGSESSGVNPQLLEQSDSIVHIPMRGQNSSMNVAMACAIATFEITRRY